MPSSRCPQQCSVFLAVDNAQSIAVLVVLGVERQEQAFFRSDLSRRSLRSPADWSEPPVGRAVHSDIRPSWRARDARLPTWKSRCWTPC